jgi:hypothetical protein
MREILADLGEIRIWVREIERSMSSVEATAAALVLRRLDRRARRP